MEIFQYFHNIFYFFANGGSEKSLLFWLPLNEPRFGSMKAFFGGRRGGGARPNAGFARVGGLSCFQLSTGLSVDQSKSLFKLRSERHVFIKK